MSTQLNEMGAWFFLRMREWGIGRVGKFKLGRAPLWEKCFLNFLGKKTPKTSIFPSCGSFSPSLTNWFEQNVFGNPIEHSCSNKQGKAFWVWTLQEFFLSDDMNPPRFLFLCYDFSPVRQFCSLSHFPLYASHFPKHECPESNFVSLIWKIGNVFICKFVNFCVCM